MLVVEFRYFADKTDGLVVVWRYELLDLDVLLS